VHRAGILFTSVVELFINTGNVDAKFLLVVTPA